MRKKIFDKALSILETLSGILLFSMVIIVTIQLIFRNFLHMSTPWTDEVSRILLVWMTFIGSPVVLNKSEHLMVDLVYSKVSKNKRKIINVISSLVILTFSIFCLKLGIDLCTNKIILKSTTAAAGIPRVYMFAALPTGSILMILVAMNNLLDNVLILLGKKKDNTKDYIVDENKTLDEIEKGE